MTPILLSIIVGILMERRLELSVRLERKLLSVRKTPSKIDENNKEIGGHRR